MKNPFESRQAISEAQVKNVVEISNGFSDLFEVLNDLGHESAEMTLATRRLEEAFFWACRAINSNPNLMP